MANTYEDAKGRAGKKASKDFPQRGLVLDLVAIADDDGNRHRHRSEPGDDDRILGFATIGSQADEVLAAMQTAMLANLPYQKLRDAAITHPTIAEGLGSLLSNVPARSESDA